MALTEAYSGTTAVGTTEWSLPRDASYDIGSPTVNSGVFQTFLDVSDMLLSDQLVIRVYEKCRSTDTQRVVFESVLAGVQADPIWVCPALALMHGWDITVKADSGTITVNWSIRKV